MIQMTFHSAGEIEDSELIYAVIAARYQDKWILCRHRERTTWEIPGGHREAGETIETAAQRELFEETGATMAEIQPRLHLEVQLWINFQSGAGEIWDVYDEDRNLTGRTHRRGDPLKPAERHLVVHIWLRNREGKFLLTKRAPTKGYPNMWECTGGSALAGDDSLTAAIREVQEETGLTVLPEHGRCLYSYKIRNNFTDVWLFDTDAALSDVVLLEGETTDAMYATREEIMKMYHDGILVPFPYIDHIFDRMS